MLLPYALTTLVRVKEFLGITGTSDDALLENLINRSTDWFESRTGRRFLETVYTDELFDGGEQVLFLRQYPVTVLTKLEFRDGPIDVPTYQEFKANEFVLRGPSGYVEFLFGAKTTVSGVLHDGKTARGAESLRATYTAGFKIDFTQETDPNFHTLPLDIEATIIQLVGFEFNRRKAQGVSQETVEGAQITWQTNLVSGAAINGATLDGVSETIKKYQVKLPLLAL